MNLLNLTDEDLVQLRTIPTSFRACPHWDNRIRFFELKGVPYVLFCCNRPDLDGDSEPIGEGIQRSHECIIKWYGASSPRRWAAEVPIIAYMLVGNTSRKEVAILSVLPAQNTFPVPSQRYVEEEWQRANKHIDKLLEEDNE